GRQQLFLADEFIEGPRAHPLGERSSRFRGAGGGFFRKERIHGVQGVTVFHEGSKRRRSRSHFLQIQLRVLRVSSRLREKPWSAVSSALTARFVDDQPRRHRRVE